MRLYICMFERPVRSYICIYGIGYDPVYIVVFLTHLFTFDVIQPGGEEAVLVVWQLATGAQSFLPRLGAPIERLEISPDAKTYAVAHSDNAIRLVDSGTYQACGWARYHLCVL